MRHTPFLKHEEFNIRKRIHELSGNVDIRVQNRGGGNKLGCGFPVYVCTDANKSKADSEFCLANP